MRPWDSEPIGSQAANRTNRVENFAVPSASYPDPVPAADRAEDGTGDHAKSRQEPSASTLPAGPRFLINKDRREATERYFFFRSEDKSTPKENWKNRRKKLRVYDFTGSIQYSFHSQNIHGILIFLATKR